MREELKLTVYGGEILPLDMVPRRPPNNEELYRTVVRRGLSLEACWCEFIEGKLLGLPRELITAAHYHLGRMRREVIPTGVLRPVSEHPTQPTFFFDPTPCEAYLDDIDGCSVYLHVAIDGLIGDRAFGYNIAMINLEHPEVSVPAITTAWSLSIGERLHSIRNYIVPMLAEGRYTVEDLVAEKSELRAFKSKLLEVAEGVVKCRR